MDDAFPVIVGGVHQLTDANFPMGYPVQTLILILLP